MFEELENIWVTEPKVKALDALAQPKITLAELYRRGWWITEIFGSYATVVSEGVYSPAGSKKRPRYYFRCRQCLIDINSITPKIQRKIYSYNLKQWKKYEASMIRPYL